MNSMYKLAAKAAMHKQAPTVYWVAVINMMIPYIFNLVRDRIIALPQILFSAGAYALDTYLNYINSLTMGQISFINLTTIGISIITAFLTFGFEYYCLKIIRDEAGSVNDIFYAFSNAPIKVLWANILMSIKIILWALLLFIPGIVAAFSYSQTYKVMIDHPEMSAGAAIKRSKELMKGHKWELFSLYLSFILWFLLSAVTSGVSSVYSGPYITCSECAFYDRISAEYTARRHGLGAEIDALRGK